jgi:hypothetical protein
MCVCVRACVRACARARARVCVCVCVCVKFGVLGIWLVDNKNNNFLNVFFS